MSTDLSREPFDVKATSETPLPITFLANHSSAPAQGQLEIVRVKAQPPLGRARPAIGGSLRAIYSAMCEWLSVGWRLNTRQAHHETIMLRAGEVLSITPRSQVAQIEVESGTIWLTETPAAGDLLLQAGDRFPFGDRSPYVLQAMGAARISIQRKRRR